MILRYVISPAAEKCGYKALRADQISEPGLITSQVIQHVIDDPLVIADLTDRNPNVFYELAIRHALRKPLIQIIKRGEQIPFDVAGTRTIQVDHHDLESVEEAKGEIIRQVKAIEVSQQEVDTPISVAVELQFLRQSDNPERRSLAEVVVATSEIRAELISFQKNLSTTVESLRDAAAVALREVQEKSHEFLLEWQHERLIHERKSAEMLNSFLQSLSEKSYSLFRELGSETVSQQRDSVQSISSMLESMLEAIRQENRLAFSVLLSSVERQIAVFLETIRHDATRAISVQPKPAADG